MEKGLISIIVPVYNRPDEVKELLDSLKDQTDKGFEIILVEDGSTMPCSEQAEAARPFMRLQYHFRQNEGRSPARNYGISQANGSFLVFVDSDCILPPDYVANLRRELKENPADCFGGPDDAHASFSDLQKAINFSMTAFLTTGGIRGGKIQMEKFVPRTFNTGFSRQVADTVGGFREMFSEDIDMSTRIRRAGFSIALYLDVKVFHKRRVSMRKFWRQVHVFGMSRITLQLLYPGSMKLVHWLPALFVLGALGLIIGSIFCVWLLIPLAVYILALFISAWVSMRRLKLALMAIATSMVQLFGYGTGFLRAYTWKILLRHGRDEQQEINMRRGK